ncbi:asparagine synthase-related protein [Roseateles chitinivorans]|uniref:asparagine synthase-related protein n=1 Tax=Roseateles chitinivorans TaxID=2917965 RepID=UPI003D67F31B
MFRYIAIAWDPARQERAGLAAQLDAQWERRPQWKLALRLPGLSVYATGTLPGVNEAQEFHDGLGGLLGKVFRRANLSSSSSSSSSPARDARLTILDEARLVDSQGTSLVRDFWGRYVAFFPTARGSVCVLRDPTGTLPCFRMSHQGLTLVFSWLEDALTMLGERAAPVVDWDAVAAQLQLGALTGRETMLKGVCEVLPGERLDLRTGGSELLWEAPRFAQAPLGMAPGDAAAQMRDTVQACARAWASCYDTVLLRLSGGLDSSMLLSCLREEDTHAHVLAVNYHSPGSDSDERDYARLMAQRAGRELVERERDPDFRIERVLRAARMPAPVPYIGWMNGASDAALARAHGVAHQHSSAGTRASTGTNTSTSTSTNLATSAHASNHPTPAMFSGTGGDLVFCEFPRWWPAADYLDDNGLRPGFVAAVMDAARLGRVSIWTALGHALREWIRPDAALRETGGFANLLSNETRSRAPCLSRFAHPLHREVSALPIGKYMQTFGLMYPIGYYDPFEQDLAPELVNPLLAQPLVELCLRLPTYSLTVGGRGRSLARQAFAGELPVQITNRRSKGGMEEHLKAVLAGNIDLVRGLLLEGALSRRGLLDRRTVEILLSGRPTTLAGAPAQLHGLVAIEAWLGRWAA